MKQIVGFAVLAAALWTSSSASADSSGYVCVSRYVFYRNGDAGQHGFVWAQFRSQPWCGGSIIAERTYCSTGATNANCASPAYLHQSQDTLMHLSSQLQSAGQLGNRVYEHTIGTINPKGYYVTFYSN